MKDLMALAELDIPLEDLLIEAANDLLVKHNRPPVIEKRQPPKA